MICFEGEEREREVRKKVSEMREKKSDHDHLFFPFKFSHQLITFDQKSCFPISILITFFSASSSFSLTHIFSYKEKESDSLSPYNTILYLWPILFHSNYIFCFLFERKEFLLSSLPFLHLELGVREEVRTNESYIAGFKR